jgi:hypothetical protein
MQKWLFSSAMAASLFGVGVASTGCTPRTVNSVEIGENGNDVVITDPELAKVASVGRVTKGRAGDLLRVVVEVRNLTDSRQGIQVRFNWLDSAGLPIPAPFGWRTEFLDGMQSKGIEGVAPDARVTNCRLEMKRFKQDN